MAPAQSTPDYYAALEISPTADLATLKANYHRLALARHPDKNLENPNATAEFQLLNKAYETLSDPRVRRDYDAQYPLVKRAQQDNSKASATKTPKEQSSARENPQAWSSSADGDAKEKEAEEAMRERAKKKRQEEEERKQGARLRAKNLQERLQERLIRRNFLNDELREETMVLYKMKEELNKLCQETEKETKEQAAEAPGLSASDSYITGKPAETQEEPVERKRKQYGRAAQTIKEALVEQSAKIGQLEAGLRDIQDEISKTRQVIVEEEYMAKTLRKDEKSRTWW